MAQILCFALCQLISQSFCLEECWPMGHSKAQYKQEHEMHLPIKTPFHACASAISLGRTSPGHFDGPRRSMRNVSSKVVPAEGQQHTPEQRPAHSQTDDQKQSRLSHPQPIHGHMNDKHILKVWGCLLCSNSWLICMNKGLPLKNMYDCLSLLRLL